ncbi:AMP-binding protein [Massilia solisilvae]|uniref:Long-chain-fatty-acid--CoA ligase n=1 Tax=Massilia solisilvae TaxID=1811225 RepID=A0ABT2BEQ4_9BURK|nr:AMP-binding protein [Massilia solisilvae]MCS0606985.1 AMP-binding protein [Massilia solisilvae]
MTVETLESALGQLPPERPCLPGVAGCETVAGLLEAARALRARLAGTAAARVALCGLAPAELVLALVALDGVAQHMLLLPASLDGAARDMLITRAGATHVLEAGLHLAALGAAPLPDAAAAGATRWVLATSGTTGTPKLIEHQLATLARTVRRDLQRGAGYVWGLLYDPSRFAGLQVVLQALFSGSPLVLPEHVEFEAQLAALSRFPVNALSATPTLWRKLLMDGRVTRLPLRQLTLGGETADQAILDALRARFPDARIVHIYASTEAGTGFAVQDGRAGFPAAWLDHPGQGPSMRIDAHGHLLIKPPLLPEGADIQARLTAEGYLDTEDLVRVEGDRVLFLGRASGAINVGGNKVNPEWLESYLRGLEGVQDARVYGKSSSMTGQLVAAEIVAAPGTVAQTLRQHIIQSCRRDLEAWQVPVFLSFVAVIKETAAGKRERIQA